MSDANYVALINMGVESSRAEFFAHFSLPFYRSIRSKGQRVWPHIEIGGDCLRLGKTTTKKVLAEQIGRRGYPFVFSDEDWKANIYLEKSYAKSSHDLLMSQQWFAQKKKAQLSTISDTSFWIQVVHPEMDFCYAMTNFLVGNLSKEQFETYNHYYEALLWQEVPAPDLLVYLTADAPLLVERFRRNARAFEIADPKYIEVMQFVNQRWIGEAKGKLSVLMVDTNDFDFSYTTGSQGARDTLGNMLFSKLASEDFTF